MATEDIPRDVVDFLAEHIDSVVQLEALLLLQSRRDRLWRAADVARELRIETAWTEAALAKLAAGGILELSSPTNATAAPPSSSTQPAYRYAPRSPQLDQTIAALAEQYGERRVSVISLIFSKPPDPIRQFTDAFRFRKDQQES